MFFFDRTKDKENFIQVQTVAERLKFRTNLYELREQRKLKPTVLYNMLTNLLYERRFGPYFIFALVIGLDPKTGETFVYDSDNIGAISDNVNLATVGTASEYIFGLGMYSFFRRACDRSRECIFVNR